MNFDKLFAEALVKGISDLEIYFSKSESTSVRLFDGEVDTYTVSDHSTLSVKGLYNGKPGLASTEKITDESIEYLLSSIIENASISEMDLDLPLFEGSIQYEEVQTYFESSEEYSNEYKINLIKDIDRLVRSYEGISTVSHNGFSNLKRHLIIRNTKGLNLSNLSNAFYMYTYAVAKKDASIKTHGEFEVIRDFTAFNKEEYAKKVATGAIKQLEGTIPTSGNYKAILSNKVAYQILQNMASNFSGENVRKGISKFAGKLDSRVGSSMLTIIDNPLLDGGLASTPFDDEGVATYTKKIVDSGELKTFLYDRKTAKMVGVESTGSGFKSGGIVSIRPTNMYIEAGEVSFDELALNCDSGIYITDVAGLHAGLNSISGDFSLQSNGFLIENGKVTKPVELFTISGNFFDLLNNIELVADDLKFDTSGTGSPSLLLTTIAVSGK